MATRSDTRVCILYTGGTVGMEWTDRGYRPRPGFLAEILSRTPRFSRADVPDFEIVEYDPLLDSSDMRPEDWIRIAEDIRDRYAEYDGFLVVHGTDTMAYTSSALSFVLEGLGKPVVLTGSQIPLCETRSDAESNLLTSLLILGRHHLKLGEVCVFFGDVLLRGNRATKVDAAGFGAFASPNLPPLGRAGIDLELDNSLVREPAPKGSLRIGRLSDATVGVFRLFPGFKAESLDALLSPPLQGLVLECYGSGNAPSKDKAFLDVLERAIARDVVIVAVSQPLYARADLHLYATGRALLDVGVVSGYDMTPEAALAKLFYLFGQGKSAGDVRRLAQEDLRGELTPPRP